MFQDIHITRRVEAEPQAPWSCADVIALVAREKRVHTQVLKHKTRGRARAAQARQIAMYLCHVVLGKSLDDVAKAFDRHRTTVSYACRAIEDLRDDRRFEAEIAALEALIEAAQETAR
jgi:chromosomal replication initiation ATPase DnaA